MSYVYVSGWLRGKGHGGLGIFSFNCADGSLELLETIDEDLPFGASVIDSDKGILYVLCSKPQDVGLKVPSGGAVYELHLDKTTGKVKEKRIVPVYISSPCNLSLTGDGKYMLICGHGSRNYVSRVVKGEDGEYHPEITCDDVPVMLMSVDEDGHLGKILDAVYHEGCGLLAKQQTAHPHCVTQSPLADFFVVCDKGMDSVFSYSIDAASGKLIRNGEPIFLGTAVCPRYSAFHPALPYVYHNSETSTDVYSYRYDEHGVLTPLSVTRGAVFEGDSSDREHENGDWSLVQSGPGGQLPGPGKEQFTEGQGLNIHPSGKYMYNVTNGTNTVDVFALGGDGQVKLIQSIHTDHAWPRGQLITPDGRFLLLSCSVGGKIIVFNISDDGMLSPAGDEIDFENAECMTLWEC
ncbi:MAG: lactonase family protein [Lachnospiraceae bacterium]|nr:lactonase family protein [Lachnospiraceae bacterium]